MPVTMAVSSSISGADLLNCSKEPSVVFEEDACPLLSLNQDLLGDIATRLAAHDIRTLARFSITCSKLRRIVNDEARVRTPQTTTASHVVRQDLAVSSEFMTRLTVGMGASM